MGYDPAPRGEDSLVVKKEFAVEEKKRKADKDAFQGEDPGVDALFGGVKRRKKNEKSFEEISLIVEKVMAELEIVAEDDAQLNRQGQPAIRKLQKLPFLREVLSKKNFQLHFLDHGILTLLKNWLEPLPDGSLPNANVRAAVLNILTEFPLDLKQEDRREQLKKSGLGRVIMFLSKSKEELSSNKRLAADLIERWSRIIFNKNERFCDLKRNVDDIHVPGEKIKPVRKPAIVEHAEADLDFKVVKEQKKQSSSKRVTRPEPASMVYSVRPQSKCTAEIIMANRRQQALPESRQRIVKRLKQLKGSNRRRLQIAC